MTITPSHLLWAILIFILILVFYIKHNDEKITRLPENYQVLTTKERVTPEDVKVTADRLEHSPININEQLPPKTGRKYIIVGGGGFLGGWITTQLLDRGEPPTNIRLLDIRPPPSSILKQALKDGVEFIKVDISDRKAVLDAFSSPWPSSSTATTTTITSESDGSIGGSCFSGLGSESPVLVETFEAIGTGVTGAGAGANERGPINSNSISKQEPKSVIVTANTQTQTQIHNPQPPEFEITVFHTAANIRFYERFLFQLPLSTKINVKGTQNVLIATKQIKANVLVYTSSGSVGIKSRSNRFLLWPWVEKEPRMFVQVIRDEDQVGEKYWKHEDYFSNYAFSKGMGEKLVREANGSLLNGNGKVLKTGCIRPGNGVFGPRGDMLCGAYVARKTNPSWIGGLISSHCYVENCALAHLLYEQRLIALSSTSDFTSTSTSTSDSTTSSSIQYPDISGQAFNVCDPGPTPTNGDVFTTLTTLTNGECHFPTLSPTFMLLFAHLIEFYYTLPSFFFNILKLPRIIGNLVNLQPSIFSLTQIHLVFDDSRARLPIEKGGLGYKGAWTTLEAVHKTVDEHYKSLKDSDIRADMAGVNFDVKFWGKKNAGAKKSVRTKVVDVVEVSATAEAVSGIVPVEVIAA